MTDLHALLREAYLLGFSASGEGWNGEYPFEGKNPPDDIGWTVLRDDALAPLLARIDAALAEPQEPVAWRYRWAHGQDLRWRFIEKKPRNTVGFEKADVEPLYAPQPAQEKP